MANTRSATLIGLSMFIAGIAVGEALGPHTAVAQAPSGAKAAYMVVSSRPVDPAKTTEYRRLAAPLAREAGMEQLATGDPKLHVLEGTYPLDGTMTIEKYRSMDDLLKFWNSPGYREAQKLRAGLNNVNFIVAIESR